MLWHPVVCVWVSNLLGPLVDTGRSVHFGCRGYTDASEGCARQAGLTCHIHLHAAIAIYSSYACY